MRVKIGTLFLQVILGQSLGYETEYGMHRARLMIFAWLAFVAATTGAEAAAITSYSGGFNAVTSPTAGKTRAEMLADGWDYLWNANGPIGTSANYESLKWNSSLYTPNGAPAPQAGPAAYTQLASGGGHPGRGASQLSAALGLYDRCPIAAYTLQANQGGLIAITNSSIRVSTPSSNGVLLSVYVGDSLWRNFLQPGGVAASNFNSVLGLLNPGQTIYVGVGANGYDYSDSFSLGYTIDLVQARNWDADGTGTIDGGSGTWNTSSNTWNTALSGGAYGKWDNATSQSAHFTGTGGAVTLGEPVTTRSLIFSADGYSITGSNALTLTSAGSDGVGAATVCVVSSTDTATISSPIAGSAGLTKSGGGTLVLANPANNYTGMTTINAGTLKLGVGGGLTTSADPALQINGGALDLDGFDQTVHSVNMAGGRIQTGTGTLTVTNSNTYYTSNVDGPATISGKLRLANKVYSWSTFEVDDGPAAIDLQVSAAISDRGQDWYKDRAGTMLVDSPSSTFTGRNIVRRGTLLVGADAPQGGPGALGNSSSPVQLGDANSGVDRALLTYGAVAIGRNIDVGNNPGIPFLGGYTADVSTFSGNINLQRAVDLTAASGGRVEFTGVLSGTGGVVKIGVGDVALTNSNNSYTDQTAVRQGSLIVAANAPSGANGALGNTTSAISVGDAVTPLAAVRVATTGSVGGTFAAGQYTGMPTSIDGIALAVGDRVLVKNEGGTSGLRNGIYVVSAATVWDRAADLDENAELLHGVQVSVTSGSINAGKRFFLGNLGTPTLDTTALDWQAEPANPNVALLTSGAVTIGRNIVVTDNKSTGTSTLGGTTADGSTFAGTVTFNKNAILAAAAGGTVNFNGEISGAGGITKTGDGIVFLGQANTYEGLTTISAGTVKLGNANALGSTANGTKLEGGTLDLNGFILPTLETLSIKGAGADGTGALVNRGNAITEGVSKLTLTGDATIGGTNRFDLGRNGGSINGGTYTLTKKGSGYIAITTGTVSVGNLVIDEGTLSVEVNNAMGNTGAAYSATVNALGTLQYWSSGVSGNSNSKSVILNGGKLRNANGYNTQAGSLTLSNNANVMDIAANNPGDGSLTITGKITGPGGFAKTGAETLVLANSTNDYEGATKVNAGILKLGAASSLGSTLGVTLISSGATLDLAGFTSGSESITLSGAGVGGQGVLINSGASASMAGPITLDADATIGGSGGITLDGTLNGGILTLTKIGTGTLAVNSPEAAVGQILVNAGQLGGNGVIDGDVTVGSAGTLSAGNSPGHLTIVGDYVQNGTMLVEINGINQGSDYDWLEVGGQATLAGTINVEYLNGFTPSDGQYFDILTAAGGITNANLDGVTINFSGTSVNASIVQLGDGAEALRLSNALAAVPEPASFALALLASVLGLGVFRRFRA